MPLVHVQVEVRECLTIVSIFPKSVTEKRYLKPWKGQTTISCINPNSNNIMLIIVSKTILTFDRLELIKIKNFVIGRIQ